MDTCVGCRIVYLLSTVFLFCIVSATSGQYVGACFLLYKLPIWRYVLSNSLRTEMFAMARVVSAIVGS